jgi:hypothetical protein
MRRVSAEVLAQTSSEANATRALIPASARSESPLARALLITKADCRTRAISTSIRSASVEVGARTSTTPSTPSSLSRGKIPSEVPFVPGRGKCAWRPARNTSLRRSAPLLPAFAGLPSTAISRRRPEGSGTAIRTVEASPAAAWIQRAHDLATSPRTEPCAAGIDVAERDRFRAKIGSLRPVPLEKTGARSLEHAPWSCQCPRDDDLQRPDAKRPPENGNACV